MPIIRYVRTDAGLIERKSLTLPIRSVFDDSVVDKSSFRPNVNDVHNFTGGSNGMVPLYEFSDGVDTGLRLGALRSIGSDITEISATQQALEKSVQLQKDNLREVVAQEFSEFKEKLKKRRNNELINNSDNSTDITS